MSKVHNDGPVCFGCAAKFEHGHPELKKVFEKMKKENPDIHVSWVWRGPKDQEEAYSSGASNCHFGKSQHNKMSSQGKPCSRAFDLFIIDADGVPRWPGIRLAKLHEWKRQNAPNMRPDIIKFKNRKGELVTDWPHFEIKESIPQP